MKWWVGLIFATGLGLGCCCIGGIISLFLIPGAVQDAAWGRAERDVRAALEQNTLVQQRIGVPIELEVATEYTVLFDDPDVIAWFISGEVSDAILIVRVATNSTKDKDEIDWAVLREDRQEVLQLEGYPPDDHVHFALGDDLADDVVEKFRRRLEELLGPDPVAWINWTETNELDNETGMVIEIVGPGHMGAIHLEIAWDEVEETLVMMDATLHRDDERRFNLGSPGQE